MSRSREDGQRHRRAGGRWPAARGGALALLAVTILGWPPWSARPQERSPLFDGWLDGPGDWSDPLRPSDHDARWLETHGDAIAAGESGDCASCHTEETCTTCHAGMPTGARHHPPGWLPLHGAVAGAQEQTCAGCHTPETFCAGCHVQAGLRAEIGMVPPPHFETHPPNWAAQGHADAARGGIDECASCHTPDSCSACHIENDPHGATWSSRCRPLLERQPDTCATCHTPGSRLPIDSLPGHPSCQ